MDVQKKTPIDEFFSPQGPLNDCLDNYQLREEQVEMAKSVSHAIAKKKSLVVEAGTGVGKTFAYLYPALLEVAKCYSTATKNLQDQLFFSDILK